MIIGDLLDNLATVIAKQKELKAEAKALNVDELTLRAKVDEYLKGNDLQKTSNDKTRVFYRSAKVYKVVDEEIVKTFLKSNGILEEYIKLDITKTKELAKKNEVPGIEVTEVESLVVSEVKEKVEAVVDDESQKDFMARVRNAK